MKKAASLIILLALGLTCHSQVMNKQVVHLRVQPSHNEGTSMPKSAPIQFAEDSGDVNVVYGKIDENGDTLLFVNLPEVDITLMNHYYEIMETNSGRRLVRNVRKVYPYARLAAEKLQEYDTLLMALDSEHERKQMMKKAEKEITDQYTEELKRLTTTQGAILIRLIDRETGNTSYTLVKELRGKIRAVFYQGFARLWGFNLKTEYDPKSDKEDNKIETIVTLLERKAI